MPDPTPEHEAKARELLDMVYPRPAPYNYAEALPAIALALAEAEERGSEEPWFVLFTLGWQKPSHPPPENVTLQVVTGEGDIVRGVNAGDEFWSLDGVKLEALAWLPLLEPPR